MPYVRKKLVFLEEEQRAFKLLMQELNINQAKAQSLIDKKRVFVNDALLCEKAAKIRGQIELVSYELEPRGLKPVYEEEDFAIYEKASGVLSHPNGRNCAYSLCDEIWFNHGFKAVVAHRLDKDTSGLLLVAKNEKAAKCFKGKFAKKEIEKSYLAMVFGHFPQSLVIKAALIKDENIRVKMRVALKNEKAKEAMSSFSLLQYLKEYDISLIKAIPHSGRQHQLRVHLAYHSFPILGDILYALDAKTTASLLDKELEKSKLYKKLRAKRLLLHANYLGFEYKGKAYEIFSNTDVSKEFLSKLCI